MKGLDNSHVVDEDKCAYRLSLVAFPYSFGFDGGADLSEGGRDISRRVLEGGAGVTDGDAYELEASPVSSESAEEGVVLLDLLG